MTYKNFDELIGKVQGAEITKKVVVVAAQDPHTLEAVFQARKDKIVNPILIGDSDQILEILKNIGEDFDQQYIIETKDD